METRNQELQFDSAQYKTLILILSIKCSSGVLLLISYINVHASDIIKTAEGDGWGGGGGGDHIISSH